MLRPRLLDSERLSLPHSLSAMATRESHATRGPLWRALEEARFASSNCTVQTTSSAWLKGNGLIGSLH